MRSSCLVRLLKAALTAALVHPCAAQSVLHNITFKVHIVLDPVLQYRDNNTGHSHLLRSHLELGHMPAHAGYSGALVDIFNEIRDRGGFEYVIAKEYDDDSYTAAFNAVNSSWEPNEITLGLHWLSPGRVDSVHSINLNTYQQSHGYRLRTWARLDTWTGKLIRLTLPLAPSLWAALAAFLLLTAIFFVVFDKMGDVDRGLAEKSITKRARAAAMDPGHWEGIYRTLLVCCGTDHFTSKRPSIWVLNLALNIFALIFVATYTASLTSLYTQSPVQHLQSIHDLPPGTVVCTRRELQDPHSSYYVPSLETSVLDAAEGVVFVEKEELEGKGVEGMLAEEAERKGCTAILDYVQRATAAINKDPECLSYIGWQGSALLNYPTVLFHSPATEPRVVRALDSLISTMRTDGFIDRAYGHNLARTTACPHDGFTPITVDEYVGLFVAFIPMYAAAIALRYCHRPRVREKAPGGHGVPNVPVARGSKGATHDEEAQHL